MKKLLFCIILLLYSSIVSYSQQLSELYNEANNAYAKGEFNAAIELYSEIANQYDKIPWVYIQLANSYRHNLQYNEALTTYQYIVDTYKQKYPECYFRLAEMQQILGLQADAIKNYTTYIHSNPNDTSLVNYATKSISSIKSIKKSNDSIILRIDSTAKFAQYYGVSKYKNQIIYNGIPRENDSIADYSSFYIPEKLVKDFMYIFSVKNVSFSDFCITQNPDSLLLTIRKSLSFSDNPGIYYSNNKNGYWTTPMPLDLEWEKEAIVIHPQIITIDSIQYFIFSSDLPNGYGGMDIWYCKIMNDFSLSKPINLGNTINTNGDEICPFYDSTSNKLFYSSSRHGSMGGYDIFYSENHSGIWGNSIQLAPPINSSFNEYYYKIIDSTAYFSSNRIPTMYDSSTYYYNKLFTYTIITKSIYPKIINTKIPENIQSITLYFDHDCPHENDKLLYSNDYEKYLLKQNEYLQQADSANKNIIYFVYKKQMSTFFNDYVTPNYVKLSELLKEIERLSELKDSITIELQAYTSIGGSKEYNEKLAERRINSVLHYLEQEITNKSIHTNNIIYKINPAIITTNVYTETEKFTLKEALQRKVSITIY